MCEMEGADDADDGVGVTSGERREKCVRFVIVRTLSFLSFLLREREMIVRTVRTPGKSMFSMGFAADPPSSATVRIVRRTAGRPRDGVENV
jgi:hypothetical protein